MTTATATTTPQNNDIIGSKIRNNRAARAAQILANIFEILCTTTTWNHQI